MANFGPFFMYANYFGYASTCRNVVVNTTDPANLHIVGNITNDVGNLHGANGVDVSPDGDYLYGLILYGCGCS